jgi:hypothetical protein
MFFLRYHRRFIEVANDIYVSRLKETERENVFSNVIDFFNETWKDTPKPFKYNQRIKKKKNLATDEAEASRNTTTQPTEYMADDGVVRYNKRKLTELPGFISQLTSNLSIPLACKHIFFNYEFSHGKITCFSYNTVFDNIEKFSSSSYALSEENKNSRQEINYLNLLYFQCLISISDYPDSMAIQILSRTLIFYGYLGHFTEFIKQSDKLSPKHCALIAPYQYLAPPGIGPFFTLEKHTKPINFTIFGTDQPYIFTLSDKIHVIYLSEIKSCGEIELPKLNESDFYKQFFVCFAVEKDVGSELNLKKMNGVAVVISNHLLYSINFDSTVNFMKTFGNIEITKIHQISSNHVLVFFENTKYFEIYNVYTGEMVLNRTFDMPIKFLETSLNDELATKNYISNVNLNVVLKNSEINIFSVIGELTTSDKKMNNIKIDLIINFKSMGIDCVACAHLIQKDYQKRYNKFLLSFKDGSMVNLEILESSNVLVKCIKPNLNEKQISMRLIDFAGCFLFLGENQYIYLLEYFSSNNFVKVGGTYNNGRFFQSEMICCVNMGLLDIYRLSNSNEKSIKSVLVMQIDAHFMDITSLFIKGILKLSKRVFFLN